MKIYAISRNNYSSEKLNFEKLFKLPYSTTIKIKDDISDIVINNSEDRSFSLDVNSRDLEFEVENPKELLVYLTQENEENNKIRFFVPNTVKESFDKNIVKIRNKISGQEIEINVSFQNYKPFSFGFLNFFGIFSYFSLWSIFTLDFIAIVLISGVTIYLLKSYMENSDVIKFIF